MPLNIENNKPRRLSEAFFLPLCGFSIFEQVDQFDYCFHKFPKKDLVRFKALQYVGDCEV